MKKTSAVISCIFLLALTRGIACGGEAAPAAAPEGEPQKIAYEKHGVPRLRTGFPYNLEKMILLAAEKPRKHLLTYTPSEGFDVEALDLQIKPSTTYVQQWATNTNTGSGNGKVGGSWVGYINFEKKVADCGLLFLQLQPGWGNGVQTPLNLFSNVDHNAHDVGGKISLRKYWYEHYLFGKQVTVRCGVLRPQDWFDQNNCADDDDVQFLSDMFNNSPAIEWPDGSTFGQNIHMAFDKIDFLEADLAHYEGDKSWRRLYKDGMYTAQATVKSAQLLKLDPKRWAGSYRLYSWINNRNHSKLVAQGQTQGQGEYVNYGAGLSFDQMVTKTLDVFGRFGWQRPDLIPAGGGAATIDISWSGGVQVCGAGWQRPQDHVSLAVGQNFPSVQYEDAGNPASNEGHIETYYSWRVNKCLAVSPGVQFIWNPNGVTSSSQGDADPICVVSARVHFVF